MNAIAGFQVRSRFSHFAIPTGARDMKRTFAPIVFAAFVWAGTQAFADEPTPTSATMSPHQMMKDCMARQRAKDRSMSKEGAKKACKD